MLSDIYRDLERNAGTKGALSAVRAFIFCPGFSVALRYRLSHYFQARSGKFSKFLSRIIWLSTVRRFSCYIAPTCHIGPGVFFPHPVGIVLGEAARIGGDATIYQNVTLGRAKEENEEYPCLGDGVTIYAGALILGPVAIGDGATIGANSVVNKNLPAYSVAAGSPARILTSTSPEKHHPT